MNNVISKLRMHWRQGTLWDVMLSRFGVLPLSVRVKYFGSRNSRQAAKALARYAGILVSRNIETENPPWVLSLGDNNPFHCQLNEQLEKHKIFYKTAAWEEIGDKYNESGMAPVAILSGYPDARRTHLAAEAVGRHRTLAQAPFEYAAGLDDETKIFARLDEYADTSFVSPLLIEEPSPYTIYQESLEHFEQKCGLRDFLDLYQLIKSVVQNDIPGDIAEFGSYKGHSGWLIARSLQELGSNKRLFMFDTFESFPEEALGVDSFWSSTHKVDFEEVRVKLSGFDNVRLVKGDFTQTLAESDLEKAALAYIDCDSYRATRFLLNRLISSYLPSGGVLVCEDYGHPALLGNRLAVHENLENIQRLFRFFSQFSGLYIAVKH